MPRKKSIIFISLSFLIVLAAGFLMSAEPPGDIAKRALNEVSFMIRSQVNNQLNRVELYPNAQRCFFYPEQRASEYYRNAALPVATILIAAFNILFNAFFQPLFLCVFTPQTVFFFILFPFFLYGAVKYFKKLPLIVIFLVVLYFYISAQDPFTEALIRHRMSCEMLYILIGLAGLVDWITGALSS